MGQREAKIRNVGLFADGGTGKTTLAEAMLYTAGVISRMGSVADGNTVMDYDEEEKERGCSLQLAIAQFNWKDCKINLVDTPGQANFISDTYGALRVVDGAVVLVSAVDGVKVQTEKLWGIMNKYNLPRIIFVNEMDKPNANFEKTLEDIKESLGVKPTPIQLPIMEGEKFVGIYNLLARKAFYFENGNLKEGDAPEALKETIEKAREALIENIAETKDELLEKYLEGEELTRDELIPAFKEAILEGKLFPAMVGSAVENKGVSLLLDKIVELLPSPYERPPVKGINPETGEEEERKPSIDEPFCALVFKTLSDPYAGKISLARIFSGKASPDTTVLNPNRETKEKLSKPFFMVGKEQKPAPELVAGDIVAIPKLKETRTGDTLCDPANPIKLPEIEFPQPILSYAIKAKSRADEDKISTALQRALEEDMSLEVRRDPQTKELLISGLGQMHIETVVSKMKKRYGVDVELQKPKVPYKETIKGKAEVQGKYVKQSGGRGQYGVVWLRIEPLPRGAGFEFVDQIVGGVVPRQYIPSVEKGVRKAMEEGVLAGYPVVDVKVTLYDGKHHPVDSSDLAFQIAASMAFKEGAAKAKPVLLEPIMKMEVIVPDECVGDVIGDLNARRGKIMGVEAKGKNQVIKALVPLAEVLTYAPELRSLTGGRGTYSMEFSHYEEVPAQIAKEIIEKAREAQAE